jgi:hypothetical protein
MGRSAVLEFKQDAADRSLLRGNKDCHGVEVELIRFVTFSMFRLAPVLNVVWRRKGGVDL